MNSGWCIGIFIISWSITYSGFLTGGGFCYFAFLYMYSVGVGLDAFLLLGRFLFWYDYREHWAYLHCIYFDFWSCPMSLNITYMDVFLPIHHTEDTCSSFRHVCKHYDETEPYYYLPTPVLLLISTFSRPSSLHKIQFVSSRRQVNLMMCSTKTTPSWH